MLSKIKGSHWYTNNAQLQAYLENEWLNCKPVSASHLLKIVGVVMVLLLVTTAALSFLCITLNANRRTKNGRDLRTRLLKFNCKAYYSSATSLVA